jgi:glycosyltransferase involved in cell wall biosynthesis
VRELADLLDREKPDVLHLHNVYPLISPWAVRTAKSRGIPVLQSVHNFRHTCIEGQHFRDSKQCFDCLGGRWATPGVRHGCYRGSRGQSALMAIGAGFHHSTWAAVDRYLCVSQFIADGLAASGLPEAQIFVKPNGVPDRGKPTHMGDGFLFVGRLTEAKGVALLLDAWARREPSQDRLVIAGDGDLRPRVEACERADPSIKFVGPVTPSEVRELMDNAAVVVVPSVCNEAFGLTVAEAFAAGRSVLGTRVGALPELVSSKTGWVSEPNVFSLAAAFDSVTEGDARTRGQDARACFEVRLSPSAVADAMLFHYNALVPAR